MKKALMLRSLLAAATLSLGSVALAGSAGATVQTINMYVGTNVDTPTWTTMDTWGATSDWSLYSDATNTDYGQWAAAYADCNSAANTDCSLREAVAVSNKWWLQPAVVANINADIATAVAYDQTVAGGSMSYADAWTRENNMDLGYSTVSQDLNAGAVANGGYNRYALNFTQLKATYTISDASGGAITTSGDINLNIVGRGANNTVIVGDGNTDAFNADNGNSAGPNSLYLQDMTFKDFTYNQDGSVIQDYGNATLTLVNVSFKNNETTNGTLNGTIYSEGTLNITGGSFINNITGDGGAIYVYNGGAVNITGVQFSGNTADFCAGGAVYIYNTPFAVASSSFDHNFANDYCDGSAIYVQNSTGTINNTTVYQNSATEYGAVAIYNSTAAFLNDTIVGNQAITGAAGLQFDGNDTITMGSTILLNNVTAGAQANCSTFAHPLVFTSLGGNVVSKGMAGGCRFGAHDKFVTSYKLGKYGFHGGLAQTLPLVAKSVGTAFAPRATCLAKDARGVSRGTTGTCDAGAYQVTKK